MIKANKVNVLFHVVFRVMIAKYTAGCDMHLRDLTSVRNPYFIARIICSWLIYDQMKQHAVSK